MTQRVDATLRAAIARLDAARVDAPAATARRLLSVAAGQPREWLVAHGEHVLDAATLVAFDGLLARAIAHEPLAYILGERAFRNFTLKIDPRALIPRPETELLVDLALAALADEPTGASVIDVGTGSGAAAIALALEAPRANVIACDISREALALAAENAARLNAPIRFVHSDLLSSVDDLAPVIVANLPYVTREEIEGLPLEIQAHEPRVALDGGLDGLDLVRRLLDQLRAPARRAALRALFLEVGASQGPATQALAARAFPEATATIHKDLAGLDRVIGVRFNRPE